MPKVSNLPASLLIIFLLAGCSSFSGSSYYGESSFHTPDQYTAITGERGYEGKVKLPPGYSRPEEFKMQWPVFSPRLNRGFRPSNDRDHAGIDLGGHRGDPILAAHDGVVIFAGTGFKGYGRMVIVEFDHTFATLYAHLDKISVRNGQFVQQGQPIGQMGRSGRATGVHLHFELLENKIPIDPIDWLPALHLASGN